MIRDIINTYREAFRQWVRSKTRPKTIYEAEEKKLFWSKCYLFCATSVVAIYAFHLFKEGKNFGNDTSIPMPLRLAKGVSNNESVRVIKYVDFKRVSDETLNLNDIEKDTTTEEEGRLASKPS